ncbi:hypothetical protein [Dyella sp. 2HG41-7]|uniref:hypothetical protein n=1 Tax=Dyella sp. 2HG41-7 TaxID=2883239 RepID=UPI001F236BA7|nr:hypothetical protein [Dyella sp. 2HG41-7]
MKRAYARLLKTTRPDDDPQAFQQLHAAYKTALAHANARPSPAPEQTATVTRAHQETTQSPAEAPVSTHAPAPSTQAPAATVTAPRVDFNALANDVIQIAAEAENPDALRQWLQSRQEFWSIQVKQHVGHLVLQRLFQKPRAMAPDRLDTLLDFFDLDHVLSGIDPIALQKLRIKQMIQWELVPANYPALAQRIGKQSGSKPDVAYLAKDIAFLQRPFAWPRALIASLLWGRRHEIGKLVRALLGPGGFQELPPSIDRHHAQFWYQATEKNGPMTQARFAVDSIRMLIKALLIATGVSTVYFLMKAFPPESTSQIDVSAERVTVVFAATVACVFGIWLLYIGSVWFDRWQGMPEYAPTRRPWLKRLAIPALCVFGLILPALGAPILSGAIVVVSFLFAIRKFRRRTNDKDHFLMRITASTRAIVWIGIATTSALSRMQGMSDLFVPFMAIVTFAILLVDFWQHRAYVHPKLAGR